MTQAKLHVDGMMCGMCEAHVKDAIRKRFPEAKKVSANHGTGQVKFQIPDGIPKHMIAHDLQSELSSMGYNILDVDISKAEESKGLLGRLLGK